MTTHHANRASSPHDAWTWHKIRVDRTFQNKNRMIARPHITYGGDSGFQRERRMLRGFQKRQRRMVRLELRDDIGFSSEAQMNMTIDESRQDSEPPTVDTPGASRNRDRPA